MGLKYYRDGTYDARRELNNLMIGLTARSGFNATIGGIYLSDQLAEIELTNPDRQIQNRIWTPMPMWGMFGLRCYTICAVIYVGAEDPSTPYLMGCCEMADSRDYDRDSLAIAGRLRKDFL